MSEDKMKTDTWNLGKLFKKQRQWVVPVYQRHYVWKSKDDDQIPGMWEDWRDQADELLTGETPRPHYFGAIIYSDRKTRDNEIDSIDKMNLVDGQQRLMTFQLALAALRYVGKSFKYKTKDIESYILNKQDDEDAYKLWPSRLDREVFRLIISPNESTLPAESALTKAYNYFCKEITRFVNGKKHEEEIETIIDALKDALLNTFQVVIIQLGEDDDPQQIFGSLNGQAEPLAPFDLIRNYVFFQARGDDGEIGMDFEEKWSYFETPFWSIEKGRGLVRKARADHFIVDAVVAETKKVVNQHRIAKEYKNYAEKSPRNHDKQLDVLIDYGKTYRAMSEQPDGAVTNRIAKMLNLWDSTTMNPLVLWIDTRPQLSQEQKLELFLMIESYIIRRYICDLGSKSFNTTVPHILNKMHKQKDNIIGAFKNFLEKSTLEYIKMPTDDEVISACKQEKIYSPKSSKKIAYILKYIEEMVGDSRFRENINTNTISVEHIMPQGWKENWRIKNGMEHIQIPHEENTDIVLDSATQELVNQRDAMIHTIGNLTLVNPQFTPIISNKSWGEKRVKIRAESNIKLNVSIAEQVEWNEESIKFRSEYLAKRINEIWKHPSTEKLITNN